MQADISSITPAEANFLDDIYQKLAPTRNLRFSLPELLDLATQHKLTIDCEAVDYLRLSSTLRRAFRSGDQLQLPHCSLICWTRCREYGLQEYMFEFVPADPATQWRHDLRVTAARTNAKLDRILELLS